MLGAAIGLVDVGVPALAPTRATSAGGPPLALYTGSLLGRGRPRHAADLTAGGWRWGWRSVPLVLVSPARLPRALALRAPAVGGAVHDLLPARGP
jgi:hypothetical protein